MSIFSKNDAMRVGEGHSLMMLVEVEMDHSDETYVAFLCAGVCICMCVCMRVCVCVCVCLV